VVGVSIRRNHSAKESGRRSEKIKNKKQMNDKKNGFIFLVIPDRS
jgi:hypothetical protein